MAAGALRVLYAVPAEHLPHLRRSGRERQDDGDVLGGPAREELIVQLSDPGDGTPELRPEAPPVRPGEGAAGDAGAQPVDVGAGRRDRVGLNVHDQLQPVFYRPVKSVDIAEARVGSVIEQAEVVEPLDRFERIAGPHLPPVPSVHQLEGLGHELDVPYAAAHQLDVCIAVLGGERAQRPFPHGVYVRDIRDADDLAEDQAAAVLEEIVRDGGVACRETRLEERLFLPRPCPHLEVIDVVRHRDDDGPGVAVGAEPQVDTVEGALLGRGGEVGRDAAGQSRIEFVLLAPFLDVADEEQIDVGGVVQLVSSELPHRDHGEPLVYQPLLE